jgi:hypothetical protein
MQENSARTYIKLEHGRESCTVNKRPLDVHPYSAYGSAPKRQYGAGTPATRSSSSFTPRRPRSGRGGVRQLQWVPNYGSDFGWAFVGWQADTARSRGTLTSGTARGGWRTTTARGPTRRSRSGRTAPSSTSRSSTTGCVLDWPPSTVHAPSVEIRDDRIRRPALRLAHPANRPISLSLSIYIYMWADKECSHPAVCASCVLDLACGKVKGACRVCSCHRKAAVLIALLTLMVCFFL